jgi:transglutaminase-like putative cysteine protease
MNAKLSRRDFAKYGFSISAAFGLSDARFSAFASSNEAKWRTFDVLTRINVADAVGGVRIWAPLPLMNNTDYFMREPDKWNGNYKSARVVQTDMVGTGLLFAEWPPSEKNPTLEIKSRFMTQDRRVDLSGKPNPYIQESKGVLDYFRRPTRLIRTDGIVASTSKTITSRYKTDVDKARAIYDWIVENTFRDPKIRGCGIGDITTMLETGYLGGKCADLNALYVGLARAAGLAARDVYGVRVASSAEFKSLGKADDVTGAQHCRAEVFLNGFGWTPVDPADVRKVVLEENAPGDPLKLDDPKVKKAHARLFGAWEMNWLPYNYAHDVELPQSHGPQIAYLMYPQCETANGRKDSLDAKNFTYSITSKEV